MSRLKNVDLIDFRCLHHAHGPLQALNLDQFVVDPLPHFLAELFRIVDLLMGKTLRKNHRSHDNRTSEWSPSRLVHPDHRSASRLGVSIFIFQIRHCPKQRKLHYDVNPPCLRVDIATHSTDEEHTH